MLFFSTSISHAFTMLNSVYTSILSPKQLIMLFQMWYVCAMCVFVVVKHFDKWNRNWIYIMCVCVIVLMKTENQYVCCVTYLCDAYALINIGIKVIMINGTHFFTHWKEEKNSNIFNMVININEFHWMLPCETIVTEPHPDLVHSIFARLLQKGWFTHFLQFFYSTNPLAKPQIYSNSVDGSDRNLNLFATLQPNFGS